MPPRAAKPTVTAFVDMLLRDFDEPLIRELDLPPATSNDSAAAAGAAPADDTDGCSTAVLGGGTASTVALARTATGRPKAPDIRVVCGVRNLLERSIVFVDGPDRTVPPIITVLVLPFVLVAEMDRAAAMRDAVALLASETGAQPSAVRLAVLLETPNTHGARNPCATTSAEHNIVAALLAASTAVCTVRFGASPQDFVRQVIGPLAGYLRRGGHRGRSAAITSLTAPCTSGKIDTDWARGYMGMLMEIPGVSERRARCIASVCPTMSDLMASLDDPVKLRRLADAEEPGVAASGADRASRRLGMALVQRIVAAVRAPYDPRVLEGLVADGDGDGDDDDDDDT